MAVQIGGSYLEKMMNEFDGDYKQYEIISDNLCNELARFTQNTNVTLYSGTNDVSDITGTTSTLKAMMGAVGKTVTDDFVISTSLDHDVATRFGIGTYHTVLEFYAPSLTTKGAYLYKTSIN